MADFPHADEVVWCQFLFEMCQSFPQQVTVFGGVYAGIVPLASIHKTLETGTKKIRFLSFTTKAFERPETTERF